MATGLHAVVAGPPRQPPTLNLYRSSRTVLDDPDLSTGNLARWEGGVQFEPEICGPNGEATAQDCGPGDPFNVATGVGPELYEPFLVRVADRCQARPGEAARLEGRVRRALDVDQHYQLEREFWTGEIASSLSTPNRYLIDSNVADLSPSGDSPLRYALGGLQEALAGCRPAGRGMIHCTVVTAMLWDAERLLHRDGALLLDVFDNIIVPGVGYDGSDPSGDIDATGETAYAYATGIVDSRFSTDVMITGLNGEEIDPSSNDQIVRASRFAAAYWDGCCQFGIRVDHCLTGCGGGS